MADKSNPTVAHVIGEITWLLTQTATHKHLTFAHLEHAVMPALLLKQYRIFYNEDKPVAFAVWAYLSQEVEDALLAQVSNKQPVRMNLEHWHSGDRPWLMELVSPFATPENKILDQLVQQLTSTVFKDKELRFIKFDAVTNTSELATLNRGEMGNA